MATSSVRAIRSADRLSLGAAPLQALEVLAIAVARAGHQRDAATLVGYSNATVGHHAGTAYPWVPPGLDDILAGMPDRDAYQASGAALSRGQLVSLVNNLENLATDL
jgi:hypothetical protein